MDRINGAGNVARMFVAEDIVTNRPPTEVTAEWLNSIQEELVSVIVASGAALDPASVTQLLDALRSAGVFQTPPQFDSSTKAATTVFVQRALGNSRGDGIAVTVNTVLTHAQAGNLFICNSSGIQLTLPALASAAPGESFHFLFTLPGTIKGNAAEVIQWGTGFGNVKTCLVGESVTVTRRASNWDVKSNGFGGESFGASFATSGYQKLPSGLFIQWGSASLTTSALTITLPIAFPTAGYGVIGFNTQDNLNWPNCYNLTTSQFTAHSNTGSGGLFYIALGK